MEQTAQKQFKLPKIGSRIVKTLLSVSLILALYAMADRNACFACIGAVFGMGNVWRGGLVSGGNRFVGTAIGGVIAVAFYSLYQNRVFGIPGQVYLVIGLFLVLYVSQLLGAHGSIQPGTVVLFVVILTVSPDRYITYTLARVIDTGIGVAMSLLLNKIWPTPQDKKQKIADLEQDLEHTLDQLDELE